MDMNLRKLREIVKDREAWRAAVHGIVNSQTWVRDWTTTTLNLLQYCLFYVLFFWPWLMWDLSSPTMDWTGTPCIGRQSLNLWTDREVLALRILKWFYFVWKGILTRLPKKSKDFWFLFHMLLLSHDVMSRVRGSRGRGHMYTYSWFMMMYGRNHLNIVKQLSFN